IGTGYAFGTMRFLGDRIVFPVILLGIIFPYEATVIPLYYDFQNVPVVHLHLLNTYWALILPQIGQSVSFGTFWMRAFFRSPPRSSWCISSCSDTSCAGCSREPSRSRCGADQTRLSRRRLDEGGRDDGVVHAQRGRFRRLRGRARRPRRVAAGVGPHARREV